MPKAAPVGNSNSKNLVLPGARPLLSLLYRPPDDG
jgi:hypothetical protein